MALTWHEERGAGVGGAALELRLRWLAPGGGLRADVLRLHSLMRIRNYPPKLTQNSNPRHAEIPPHHLAHR